MTNPNPPPPDAGKRAVEAAYGAYMTEMQSFQPGITNQFTTRELLARCLSRAIAAADRARSRSWIDWRPHAEWTPLTVGEPYRDILVESELAQGSVSVTRMKTAQQLPTWFPRWAEMPAVDMESEAVPISDAYLIWDVDTEKWLLSPMRGLTKNEKEAFRYTLEQAKKEVAASPGNQTIIRDPQPNTPARTATHEQEAYRQERIDAAIAACTECGGRAFPKRSDCDGCTLAVDEEIARAATDGDRASRVVPFSTEVAEALDYLDAYITHSDTHSARKAFALIDDHVRGKTSSTHETPGAAVLARGAIPCSLCQEPAICRDAGQCALSATMEDVCGPDDATRLSDLKLRVIALEKKNRALRELLITLATLVPAINWNPYDRAAFNRTLNAAFPEPKPWPPSNCQRKPVCASDRQCGLLACPNHGRRAIDV